MVVTRPLLNYTDLAAWAWASGFRDLRPNVWHVTLINSRRRVDDSFVAPETNGMTVASGTREVLRFGAFTVLTIESTTLAARHREFLAAGADTDHHPFRPHVTFAVDAFPDLSKVTPYVGELRFGPEVWE